jgi:DNA-binding transcriptional regulator YhcF (GntR family)
MAELATDELSRIDEAFAGNRLLSTFPPEARALVEPQSETVRLEVGELVQQRGEDVEQTLFPFGPTMVSLSVTLAGGRSVETASIGREGAVGGIVSCGHAPAFGNAAVQVAGPALKVPMTALEDAKKRSPFLGNLFCRYSDYLLAQVMQTVACNTFHSIEQRAARWLLTTQDRAGDRIELTQEALAGLLGVQRTTVNGVVRTLQQEGLLASQRGRVVVTDRAGLKRRACECHSAIEDHFAAVIGPSGQGGG